MFIVLCLEVRKQRNRIAVLQTDHKELFNVMESRLHELHALQSRIKALKSESHTEDVVMTDANIEQPTPIQVEEYKISENTSPAQPPKKEIVPFLWVGEVSKGSPADKAGLQTKDAIVKFDSVTAENGNGLQEVAEIVNCSKGVNLKIRVLRQEGDELIYVDLEMIPQEWEGRGLIG